MSPFVANLLLALVWLVITGGFSLANLIFGFFLGGASPISSASRWARGAISRTAARSPR